ncbi:MAG: hypothetical protein ACR2N3_14665 [Pyrinomonadaceae bacterium]
MLRYFSKFFAFVLMTSFFLSVPVCFASGSDIEKERSVKNVQAHISSFTSNQVEMKISENARSLGMVSLYKKDKEVGVLYKTNSGETFSITILTKPSLLKQLRGGGTMLLKYGNYSVEYEVNPLILNNNKSITNPKEEEFARFFSVVAGNKELSNLIQTTSLALRSEQPIKKSFGMIDDYSPAQCAGAIASCALAVVGYAGTWVAIASCGVGLAPTCVLGLLGHAPAAVWMVSSCVEFKACQKQPTKATFGFGDDTELQMDLGVDGLDY